MENFTAGVKWGNGIDFKGGRKSEGGCWPAKKMCATERTGGMEHGWRVT
jgi:hypothetical protein